MSNAVSALNGAVADGFVQVTDMGPQGMITLRGDLASAPVKKALKAVGVAVPGPLRIAAGPNASVAWMAPDELLVLCPYGKATETAAILEKAMGKAHSLVANVSDARTMLRLDGNIRDVLAKLSPADVVSMGPGDVRRSRLAQIPAAFWLTDAATAHVVCFRSVAQYAFDILSNAAKSGV